jgi:MoxR-like ATPase
MPTEDVYITPITKVHSSFSETQDFFDKFGGVSLFDDDQKLDIEALVQGRRNLVVGEPGVGKSLLLQKMQEHLEQIGTGVKLINLRA